MIGKRYFHHPIIIQRIEEKGYHLFTKIFIEDVPAHVLIDTGASNCAFDLHFAEKHLKEITIESEEHETAGISSVNFASKIAVLKHLQIDKLVIPNYFVALIDLGIVNQTYSKLGVPEIKGIIGCDLLVEHKININIRNKHLQIPYPKG